MSEVKSTPELADPFEQALVTLLRELLDGPAETAAFALNRGDRGLLASLDLLSAEAASARSGDRSSVAAHVDHLRYGFELLNRWAKGENPWASANFAASWQRQQVSEAEWIARRRTLADEARAWITAVGDRRDWDALAATEALASAVHLAYHIGGIRQIAQAAVGPPAKD
jgi:hypothetical protein